MYYIGIDPGRKGGIAVLADREIDLLLPLTKENVISVLIAVRFSDAVCCLEKVHAMPGQGSVSMFSFGESYGWLKGAMDMECLSYQEIQPQRWKKEFGLNSDKTKSIEVAKQLFPDADLRPGKCRTDQDGLAEALLMAEYARRKL